MTAKPAAPTRRRRHRQAVDWLLRNRQAGQSAESVRQFEDWLARDPENRSAYRAVERLMGEARNAILADPDLRALDVTPRRGAAKAVTALVLTLCVAGGLFVLMDGPMRMRADAISQSGEMPVVMLADGSTMHLNARSAVAYDFTPARRTVRLLRGEAFFQVAADPQRPFVVESGGGRVTALGTAFDVRLGEAVTNVVVTEHAVSLDSLSAASVPVILKENFRASYGTDGAVREVGPADASAMLAWRRGQLVVDNATLADVVTELGRHFSGRIIIGSAGLAERRVSGTFSIANTDAALDFIEQSLNVTATRIGPLVVIRN